MPKPKVGDRVTVISKVEANYSNYGSHRGIHVFFMPGMTGVVVTNDTPYVQRRPGNSETFCCVDFDAKIIYNEKSENPYRWRCGVDPKNIVILESP